MSHNDIEAAHESAESSDAGSLNKQLELSKAYGAAEGDVRGVTAGRVAVVQGLNRPLFHVDVTAALNSALANAQRKSH